MKYQVRFQPAAIEDLDEAYKNAAKHAPLTAASWLERFHEALQSLEHNPQRCSLAPEDRKCERSLHQFLFGKGRNVFRSVFTVEDDIVWILRIRRAAQNELTNDEIGGPNQ